MLQASRALFSCSQARSPQLLWGVRHFAFGPGPNVDSTDSHDDFKPKAAAPAGDVQAVLEAEIKKHDVYLFMKGKPTAPQCGFSNMACRVLDAYGVKYQFSNVLADPDVREGVKKLTGWPTIPQVFVKGEFIGGSDILFNMHESGELEKLLAPIIKAQQAGATAAGPVSK